MSPIGRYHIVNSQPHTPLQMESFQSKRNLGTPERIIKAQSGLPWVVNFGQHLRNKPTIRDSFLDLNHPSRLSNKQKEHVVVLNIA